MYRLREAPLEECVTGEANMKKSPQKAVITVPKWLRQRRD